MMEVASSELTVASSEMKVELRGQDLAVPIGFQLQVLLHSINILFNSFDSINDATGSCHS